MALINIAILWTVVAPSFLAVGGSPAAPEPVTIEFLAKRSEGTYQSLPGTSYVRYTLIPWGEIWESRCARNMTDASLGRDLAYTGSAHHIRYVLLAIDDTEQTTAEHIAKALERLKAVIAKHVTGNCQVVIQIFPRDWVFVTDPAEAKEIEPNVAGSASESEAAGAAQASAEHSHTDAP